MITSTALAADLPLEEVTPQPIESMALVYRWSGLYVGGQGGAFFGAEGAGDAFNPWMGYSGTFSNRDNGGKISFVGGVHVGYDFQIDNLVLGAVVDINYVDGSGTRHSSVNGADFTFSNNSNYLGTVRGKVGYALDRLLAYGTGGLAYGGGRHDMYLPSTISGPFAGYTFTTTKDTTDVGYAVGGGFSYLATPNLSFGVEYFYTDLGKNDSSVSARNNVTNLVDFTTKSSSRNDFQSVMVTISYHFK